MIPLFSAVFLLFQAVISVHTELVVVPVVVTDAQGHRVNGLSQKHFRVYDDGRLQPITVFHHGDAPVTLGLIVDRSQSMRTKGAEVQAAVSALLQGSGPDDELFGIGFNDRVSFTLSGDRPYTHDVKELETALTADAAEGQTALYDGVAAGLLHVRLGHAERHALIVVSDGGDNVSRRRYAEILALARQSDAVIYAIGLQGTSPAEEEEDAGLLKRLCKDTGGIAYFPRTSDEIAAMASLVARDLHDQYMLGFEPAARTDRRVFRKIEVKVDAAGQGRLRARTRTGYLVDGDKP